MEKKKWKPIEGYEGLYEISEQGEVRSIDRIYSYPRKRIHVIEKLLKQRTDRAGYWTVVLHKNQKSSTKYVHRLLAKAFIPQIDGKNIVNHKNGNKLDNSLSNLEWCTHSENMKHAFLNKLCQIPQGKMKQVIDTCNGTIFKSISEAAKLLKISYSSLKNKLNGNRRNDTCLRLAA